MRSLGLHVVVEPAASLQDVERAVGVPNLTGLDVWVRVRVRFRVRVRARSPPRRCRTSSERWVYLTLYLLLMYLPCTHYSLLTTYYLLLTTSF